MTGTCEFCGGDVNTSRPGAYLKVEGWAPVRTDGGTNTIAHQRFLGPVAHRACLYAHVRGGEQLGLLP